MITNQPRLLGCRSGWSGVIVQDRLLDHVDSSFFGPCATGSAGNIVSRPFPRLAARSGAFVGEMSDWDVSQLDNPAVDSADLIDTRCFDFFPHSDTASANVQILQPFAASSVKLQGECSYAHCPPSSPRTVSIWSSRRTRGSADES
ncbi:hypothetical protein JCM7686_2028 [Paracoccus aminophilus JCM 7686]|uniref:Uncharacterized protein n=1 Tax=Paracoccus aminophilus JCM 7686 TaxID=1367847 RepID=S5XP63_PARAH|nr:hypothetical protein JCM7686_2028 [Paracoccus aminophilus JCM 7686]